jgi:ABC-type polysaccharide/polyol phosphate transport system ATPase subunit
MDPGILLMDEGISTGDQRFAERASERLHNFISRSKIIVVASHSNDMIRSMCDTAILMQAGRMVLVASVDEVLERYDELVNNPDFDTKGDHSD